MSGSDPSPRRIVVLGPPGSGKTTLARRLALVEESGRGIILRGRAAVETFAETGP